MAMIRIVSTQSDASERRGASAATPLRIWAGHGTGACCDFCGGVIAREEIEYELLMPTDGGTRTLRAHLGCYQLWRREAEAPSE